MVSSGRSAFLSPSDATVSLPIYTAESSDTDNYNPRVSIQGSPLQKKYNDYVPVIERFSDVMQEKFTNTFWKLKPNTLSSSEIIVL